jgi:hypothetical protein
MRMGFFKKKEKKPKESKKNKEKPNPKKDKKIKPEKKKKKVFLKKDKNIPETNQLKNEESDDILNEKEEKKPFSAKKKKTLIKKDMKNKPVYLEDTGEKLGIVFDTIYDKNKNIVGYKIKDGKSDAVLSFPIDQFDFTSDGLIFVPGWYTNSLKIIEKLEFKDKVSPELTALLSDDTVTNEELYDIFVKHDDDMVDYIDDAKSLREMLDNRLKVLEKQRIALKDDLMDLTEKRLIKDIDRREFSEDVMNHRRKVNILDLNINKCKDLIKRLDKTSFGVLGKNELTKKMQITKNTKPPKLEKNLYERLLNQNKEKTDIRPEIKASNYDEYKDKYFQLKNQYDQLEEEYQELKTAVDKILNKGEL